MRVGWLDTAKGLAIAGIVLIHATSWSPSPSPEATWLLQRFLASLPVFFLVSGIVAGRSLTDPAATVRTLAARVLPLCYLYTLWQPVVLGYRVLRDVTAGTSVDLVGELLRVAASPIRPNGEIWYLWALALHLVVIWATRRLPTAAVLIPTFVMCAALIGWGRTALGDDTWHVLGPGLQGLPLYLFFTVVGARAASPIVARVERTGPTTSVCALVLWAVLGELHARLGGVAQPAVGVVQTMVGTVAVLLAARTATRYAWATPISALGRWSVVPYLTHTAIIAVTLAAALWSGAMPLLVAHPTLTVAGLTILGTTFGLVAFVPLRNTPVAFAFRLPSRRRVQA